MFKVGSVRQAGGECTVVEQRDDSAWPCYVLLLSHMQELPKELVESHYPRNDQLPDYFTNASYVRFTPEVDCLALPGKCTANSSLAHCNHDPRHCVLPCATSA